MNSIIIAASCVLPAIITIYLGRQIIWAKYGPGKATFGSVLALATAAAAVAWLGGFIATQLLR